MLSLIGIVSAVPNTQIYTKPYSVTLTPTSQLGLSTPTIKSQIDFKSCNVNSNWQSKNCSYGYYCYAILPSDSKSISDALQKQCIDITDSSTASLSINNFIPPKGVLYYVTTFFAFINEKYDSSTNKWLSNTTIPTKYIKVNPIRSVCPSGQMLDFNQNTGQYQCYVAKKICLNTLKTGVCTNSYNLYALDKNNNGVVSQIEMTTGADLCADRPTKEFPNGDGICDLTKDLGCTDVCSKFNSAGQCTISGANGICDQWDQAAVYVCADSSIHSGICANIDTSLCNTNYNPVCVANKTGTTIGGQTYPNSCFAEHKNFQKCSSSTPGTNCYVGGSCQSPITQCYSSSDCPTTNVCRGGSLTGIAKSCLDNRCAYSGTCGTLSCNTNSDCSGLTMPCKGVSATCQSGKCVIQGQCLTQPHNTQTSIWTSIESVWSTFWNWITNLFK